MTWSHPGFEAVAESLLRRTGLLFGPARRAAAEAGIRRAMNRVSVSDPARYAELLETDADALDDLVVELTVGETYFFREPAQFEFLRKTALPDLWRRLGPGAAVRAWSAGCASGEEAYSLAILLAEAGAGPRTHLLATDISRAALAKARRAVYGAWSLRGEGAAAARPFLAPRGANQLILDEGVRRRVRFEYLNLALDVYPSLATDTWGMHVILCRNVLIYFNEEAIRAVARRLYQSLAPGGWLLTAASDPPLASYAHFETVTTDAGVLYRRNHEPTPLASELALPTPSIPVPLPVPETTVAPSERFVGIRDREQEGERERAERNTPVETSPLVTEARRALTQGDYERAAALTASLADADACALHVRALANLDADRAERACAEAAARHTLSTELQYLHGVLLVSLGRDEEAARAVRRALYLDRTLAVAHFTLGSILERCGDAAGARRAYRNARDLCHARPVDEAPPLSDGEPAGRLAEAAAAQLAVLEAAEAEAP